MRAHWGAPYRDEWKDWAWPCVTAFAEIRSPVDWYGVDRGIHVYYANPNAGFRLRGDIKDRFPNLSLIVTPSTGETHLDRESLAEAGIDVLSLLDDRRALDEIRASSEFTFLLILAALRRFDRSLLEKRWERDENALRGRELYGKMVGLIGHGRIGKNVENWCRGFGAGVYWNDPYDASNIYQPSVEWIFRNCPIVVVCCSLTLETRGLVDWYKVRTMRRNAILVNTSRGEVFDENGVADALMYRPDIHLWTDVLAGEESGDILVSPLMGLENVHITPHIAGTTVESQEKAARIALDLTKRYLSACR